MASQLREGGEEGEEDEPSRFDFSDTDFTAGFNFIAGARRANGMFFELRATAYGVSNIRLLWASTCERGGRAGGTHLPVPSATASLATKRRRARSSPLEP